MRPITLLVAKHFAILALLALVSLPASAQAVAGSKTSTDLNAPVGGPPQMIVYDAAGRFARETPVDKRPEWYAAQGNGTADDTAALQAALGTCGTVRLTPGRTYRTTSQLTLSCDVEIQAAGSTLLIDHAGIGIENGDHDLTIRGGTLDGNGRASRAVSGDQATIVIDGVTIRDLYSTSGGTQAVLVGNNSTLRVTGSTFERVRALANGTIGDSDGVARGIQLSANGTTTAVIEGNTFRDINSVTAGGANTHEDADGVHLFRLSGGGAPYAEIRDNRFVGVGKRAVKAQGTEEGVVEGNEIVADWPDNTEGMGSAIALIDARLDRISGNVIRGNSMLIGISIETIGTARGEKMVVSDNLIEPDAFYEQVDGGFTVGILILTGASNIRLSGNEVRRFGTGIRVGVVDRLTVSDNVLAENSSGFVTTGALTNSALTGNTVLGRASASGVGFYFSAGSTGNTLSGNSISTVNDGLSFPSGASGNVVVGNYVGGVGRSGSQDTKGQNVFIGNGGALARRERGTATLSAGVTQLLVPHTLGGRLSIDGIRISPNDTLGAASQMWVDGVNSTVIVVKTDVAPGVPIPFSWEAVAE